MSEEHHMGNDMKNEIEKKCKEREEIAKGKKEFDSHKQQMQAEILAKDKERKEIAKAKKEYEEKKPELFREIKEKVEKK